MRVAVAVAISLGIAVAGGMASAGEAPPSPEKATHAKAAYREGRQYFNLADYDKALAKFKEAYLELPDSAFLFNIAQCQRQLAQYAAASKSYRAFLRESGKISAAQRADVERLIAEMDEGVKEQRAKAPPTGTQPPVKEEEPTTPPPTTSTTPTTPATNPTTPETPPPQPPQPHRSWYQNPAGMSLSGGGIVVALVGSILLGVAASQDVSSRNALTLSDARSAHSSAVTTQSAGIALLAIGGAALITGVIVLIVARPRARPVETPAKTAGRLAPALSPPWMPVVAQATP